MSSVAAQAHERPFLGWRVVGAGVVTQALGIGFLSAYGVFVKPVQQEFDASMTALSAGFTIYMLVSATLSPFLGPILDRRPIRRIMLAGIVVMAAALVLVSRAQALWQAGALFALMAVGVQMYGSLPIQLAIVNWFVRQRGRALAIAALGVSVPGLALPPLSAFLIDRVGWRDALVVLALGAAAILLPVVGRFIVKRPEDVGQLPDGEPPPEHAAQPAPSTDGPKNRELLRQRNFWVTAFGFALTFGAPVIHAIFLVSYLEDLGISRQRASFVLSAIAAFGIIGKLSVASVADRIDPRRLLWLLLGLQAVAWAVIISQPRFEAILLASTILGLGVGGITPMSPLVIGACFGRSVFGRATGLMRPLRLPVSLAIPILGGILNDWSGGYALTFGLAITVLLLASAVLSLLRIPEHEPD